MPTTSLSASPMCSKPWSQSLVLRGDVVRGGAPIIDAIARHVRRLVLDRPGLKLEISSGDAGDRTALLGAAGLVLSTSCNCPFRAVGASSTAADNLQLNRKTIRGRAGRYGYRRMSREIDRKRHGPADEGSTDFPLISVGPIVLPSEALRTCGTASVGDTIRSYPLKTGPSKILDRRTSSSAWSTAEIHSASISLFRNCGVSFSACLPSRSTPYSFQWRAIARSWTEMMRTQRCASVS